MFSDDRHHNAPKEKFRSRVISCAVRFRRYTHSGLPQTHANFADTFASSETSKYSASEHRCGSAAKLANRDIIDYA